MGNPGEGITPRNAPDIAARGCTTWRGGLSLKSNDPVNLSLLSSLRVIEGNLGGVGYTDLTVFGKLEGLEGLVSVGGFAVIEDNLLGVDGLRSLQEINGLFLLTGTSVPDLDALSRLRVVRDHVSVSGNALERKDLDSEQRTRKRSGPVEPLVIPRGTEWPRLLPAVLVLGCGGGDAAVVLDAGSSKDSGQGDTDTSPTGTDGASESSTEIDCSKSVLPPPMCHERVAQPASIILRAPRGAWAPLVRVSAALLEVVDARTWAVVTAAESTPQRPFKVFTQGDFDGDGAVDVAMAPLPVHGDDNRWTAFRMPDLSLLGSILGASPTPEPSFNAPASAMDVDHDGRDEFIIHVNPSVYQVWSYRNETFGPAGELRVDECWGFEFESGDLDGDGYRELFTPIGPSCTNSQESLAESRVQVLAGWKGAEVPAATFYLLGLNDVYDISVGDFNADGNDDVFAVRSYGKQDELTLLYADGRGGLGAPMRTSLGDQTDMGESTMREIRQMVAADFDGDGDDEILLRADSLGMLLVEPHPGASPYTVVADGPSEHPLPYEGAVGDVNGDDRADFLTPESTYLSFTE